MVHLNADFYRRKKKIMNRLLIVVAIAVGAFGFYKAAEVFSPGRDPYAETYELPYPEEKVKEAII